MKNYILCSIIFLSVLMSCRKEIKSEKGAIDIVSNVYIDASKGLNNVQSFHISKINYLGDKIVEIVPEPFHPELIREINFIKDSLYYPLGSPLDARLTTLDYVVSKEKPISVYHKNSGAIFTKEKIPNYHNKRQIWDTILFNKPYKRFEVNSPQSFTRFYVYETDTILPYSLYRHAEIDFKGRIERIDSYDKEKDIFVSLQLIPRKTWDEDAKNIFNYTEFVNKKSKK